MFLAILDSPLIGGILTPVLTLIALATLKYVQKEITNAINGTKESVLKEVAKVDAKVEGALQAQVVLQGDVIALSRGHHELDVRMARLEGRRDAQLEAAQIAQAAVAAVDAVRQQEHP